MNRKFLSLLLVNVAVLCPSLRAQHLWWNLEGQRDATCLYGEITVLENFLGRDKAAVKLAIFRDAGGAAGVRPRPGVLRRLARDRARQSI